MQVSIPRLWDIFNNHIPLRKTSKLLTKKGNTADVSLRDHERTPIRSASKTRLSKETLTPPKETHITPSSRSSCSQVKSEPEDSPPAELEEPPAWAVELMDSLRATQVQMPAEARPVIQSAMSELADGPSWALQLHQLLEGHCNACQTDAPAADQPSISLKQKLQPKGNLSLRLGAAEDKADEQPTHLNINSPTADGQSTEGAAATERKTSA